MQIGHDHHVLGVSMTRFIEQAQGMAKVCCLVEFDVVAQHGNTAANCIAHEGMVFYDQHFS
jgi:hypothetical protein